MSHDLRFGCVPFERLAFSAKPASFRWQGSWRWSLARTGTWLLPCKALQTRFGSERRFLLAAECADGKLVGIDGRGKERLVLDGLPDLRSGRLLASGNYLVVTMDGVREVTSSGKPFGQLPMWLLMMPCDLEGAHTHCECFRNPCRFSHPRVTSRPNVAMRSRERTDCTPALP